jgi:hypothetical protein
MHVRPAVLSAVATLGAVAFLSLNAAPASAANASTAAATPDYRAHWMLDEMGGGTALDSSGNHNDGNALNTYGDGSGYTFNGSNSRVIVPNALTLNDTAGNFSWGVTLSMTKLPLPSGETYDILRKGIAGGKGGDYKLEIWNAGGRAKARCVFNSILPNGKRSNLALMGSSSVADGRPHVITCTKTSNTLAVTVDSLKPVSKTSSAGLGSVSNTYDVALGAKAEMTSKSGFDWFDGELFDAWVAAD